jgi:predicted DNA-binding transcriptional regulator YafY
MSTKLERVLAIDSEICRGRYPSVTDLCQRFEVSERTLHEDIRFLRENLAREIDFDHVKNGYFNSNPQKRLPAFELSSGEVFALTLGKELLSQYIGTSFEPTLRSALEKISERLPDKVQVDPADVQAIIRFRGSAIIPISGKLFTEINKACDARKQIEFTYFAASKGETTSRLVDPQVLLHDRGAWYLVAYCHSRKALRMFALHRIRDYKILDATFDPIPREEINKWMDAAFQLEHGEKEHNITVQFAPQASRYIRERIWHPQQALVDAPDGSCTLTFPASSLDEVLRWVCQYGADALVLEPPELRDMVKQSLTATLAKYN